MFKSTRQTPTLLTSINPVLKMGVCVVLISFALLLHQIDAIALLVGTLMIFLLYEIPLSLHYLALGAIALGLFTLFSTWFLGDLEKTIFSALRLLAISLPAPLLAGTTRPATLIRALQATRLPGFLVLSLMLIWRFLPIMQQETQRIVEANQLRGINLARRPCQWFAGLFMPLIFQIVAYADDVTIGLQTRGYDPATPRSNSQPLTWSFQDSVFGIGVFLLLIGVSYLEWGY